MVITEDYVSFETAKLLKNKSFDEPCHAYYEDNGTFRESYSAHEIRNITKPCSFGIAAPTLQMTMKWLREMYKFHIGINRGPKGYHINIETIPFGIVKYITKEIVGTNYIDSYEKACETAIDYCLKNLI